MKRYTVAFTLIAALSILLCGGCSVVLSFYAPSLYWIPLAMLLCLVLCGIFLLLRFRTVCTGWMIRLCQRIAPNNRAALDVFPLPLIMLNEQGNVLFANKLFRTQVMDGVQTVIDTPLKDLFDNVSLTELAVNTAVDLQRKGHYYTAYVSVIRGEKGQQYLLYLTDDTLLKIAAAEYEASRPVVLQICIDNLEEATEHLRAGDRARISGTIETMLEDWISAENGVLQKYGNERFVAVTEHRNLLHMTKDRFSILGRIRKAFPEVERAITLSIGVGEGKNVAEGRRMALRALDMSLSRGGDQAAVKTDNGFDFYGGHSAGVEHRTRVRTRIIADALRELMISSDRVFIMGHRMSDLDCLGSGVALAAVARRLQIPSAVVLNRHTTMAGQLVDNYDQADKSDWFISPEAAEKDFTKKSLLVIVDTHSADLLESTALYEQAERVVVLDHHRRKASYIENTILTYHEPNSSSASELVAELLPYLSSDPWGRMEAEALLAGIMLDTRNFVLRTGVRTFEAAAYLRGLGADTVAVKKMFNESLEIHRLKNELISVAEVYKDTVIAASEEDFSKHRVATAQAADDLLSVKDVKASFVVYRHKEDALISARSFGECNVQLIMESLGGGGHLTMAATQISGFTVEKAVKELKAAIDRYMTNE